MPIRVVVCTSFYIFTVTLVYMVSCIYLVLHLPYDPPCLMALKKKFYCLKLFISFLFVPRHVLLVIYQMVNAVVSSLLGFPFKTLTCCYLTNRLITWISKRSMHWRKQLTNSTVEWFSLVTTLD